MRRAVVRTAAAHERMEVEQHARPPDRQDRRQLDDRSLEGVERAQRPDELLARRAGGGRTELTAGRRREEARHEAAVEVQDAVG
jgi:hypothetical protein